MKLELSGTYGYQMHGFMHALNVEKTAAEAKKHLRANAAGHALQAPPDGKWTSLSTGVVAEPLAQSLPAIETFNPTGGALSMVIGTRSGPDRTGYYPVSEIGCMQFFSERQGDIGDVVGRLRVNVGGYSAGDDDAPFTGA